MLPETASCFQVVLEALHSQPVKVGHSCWMEVGSRLRCARTALAERKGKRPSALQRPQTTVSRDWAELPLLGLMSRAAHSCDPPCSKMKSEGCLPSRQTSPGHNMLPARRSECCCCVQSIADAWQIAVSRVDIGTLLLLLGLVWELNSPIFVPGAG